MLKTDEDALICDLAETYHIYDWRKLPVRFVAKLAYGLPSNSRIKRIINGQKDINDTMLLAIIADGVRWLMWSKTKDAEKNRNMPASIFEQLTGEEKSNTGFNSAEEFEAARAKLLGG